MASHGAELFADFQLTGNDEALTSFAPDRMRVGDTQRFIKTRDVQIDDVYALTPKISPSAIASVLFH